MTFDELFQYYTNYGFTKPISTISGIETLIPNSTTVVPVTSMQQLQETGGNGNDRDSFTTDITNTTTNFETPSLFNNIQTGGIPSLIKTAIGFAIPGLGFLSSPAIQNLNQAFRNTMFGQSRTGEEFAMRMREARQAERAQEAMPEVYQNAVNVPGALGKGGGFSSSFEDRAGTSLGSGQFSSKTSRGRQGY